MSDVAHWISFLTPLIGIPCLAVIGLMYYSRSRTRAATILALGLIVMCGGLIIQAVTPPTFALDEMGNVLAQSGSFVPWYVGSILFSIGLIFTTIGFGMTVFERKDFKATSPK